MAVAAAASAAARKTVVVGVKRPRSPCQRLHNVHVALEKRLNDPVVIQKLADAMLDDHSVVDWPGVWSASYIWNALLQFHTDADAALRTELLPVLLRSGLREVLNQRTARAYSVLDATIRASTRAAISLLQEHKRDPANCPLDFNVRFETGGRASLFMVALAYFTNPEEQEWLLYIAQHSDAVSLNASTYIWKNAVDCALTGLTGFMLPRLELLANPLVSPDDESKFRFLDGAADMWVDGTTHFLLRSGDTPPPDAAKLTPFQYLQQRDDVSTVLCMQATQLIDDAVARQAAHRARVIHAAQCALNIPIIVTDLIALVVSYLPQPPA
jgi:hypothetical protein